MKKLLLLSLITLSISLNSNADEIKKKKANHGRCSGSNSYCNACSSCNYCGHCAGGGGTCGTCYKPPVKKITHTPIVKKAVKKKTAAKKK